MTRDELIEKIEMRMLGHPKPETPAGCAQAQRWADFCLPLIAEARREALEEGRKERAYLIECFLRYGTCKPQCAQRDDGVMCWCGYNPARRTIDALARDTDKPEASSPASTGVANEGEAIARHPDDREPARGSAGQEISGHYYPTPPALSDADVLERAVRILADDWDLVGLSSTINDVRSAAKKLRARSFVRPRTREDVYREALETIRDHGEAPWEVEKVAREALDWRKP